MTSTAPPGPHACPSCRLRFPTVAGLRRHETLDHRPAADGALLTAQALQPPRASAAPPAPRAAPAAPAFDGRRELVWRAGVLLVVVLLVVASASVPAAVALLLLAFWARARIGPGLSALSRPPSTSPGAAPPVG